MERKRSFKKNANELLLTWSDCHIPASTQEWNLLGFRLLIISPMCGVSDKGPKGWLNHLKLISAIASEPCD